MVDQMQPVINTTIQYGQVAATGQPYFTDRYDKSNNKIPWYNKHRYEWDTNQWFDHCDNIFNHDFIKDFRQVFHFNPNPENASQVLAFRDAMENTPDGCYIYHERDSYVPYRIHHGHVTFNRGDAIEISQIRRKMNQNRNINTNKYNKLSYNQFNKICGVKKSVFINPIDGSYRREFLIHYSETIPKKFWNSKSFDTVFNNNNDLQTFILLDISGSYGVPIGINKATKTIILNDSTWMTWNNFKIKYNKNEIER